MDCKSSFQAPNRNHPQKLNIPQKTITPDEQLNADNIHDLISKSELDFNMGGGDGNHHRMSSVTKLEMSSSGDCKDTGMTSHVVSHKTETIKIPLSTGSPVRAVADSDNYNQIRETYKGIDDTSLEGDGKIYQEICADNTSSKSVYYIPIKVISCIKNTECRMKNFVSCFQLV